MNPFYGLILGLVQGVSEFLPISSSGHLVIAQNLMPGFSQPGVLFDVTLHSATTLAVLVYFWRDIVSFGRREVLAIGIGTIPAVIMGFAFRGSVEALFGSVTLVGLALVVTGIINFLTDKMVDKKRAVNPKTAFLVGVAQAIAIIPGISRSGSTIFTGRMLGVGKEESARFSFLLSVPAILGATFLELVSHPVLGNVDLGFYIFGFAAAFVSGYVSIKLVINSLKARNFKVFGFYCLFVGGAVIFLLA